MKVKARIVGPTDGGESRHLVLHSQTLCKEDFSGKNLESFHSDGCTFVRCDFQDMRIDDAGFGAGRSTSVYRECSFDNSNFEVPAPGYCRFERCSFRSCVIRNLRSDAVEFVDCVFSGRIVSAEFWGQMPPHRKADQTGRWKNEFRDNDFRYVDLHDVDFRGGIDLRAQLLPEGLEYLFIDNAPERIAAARKWVTSWADLSKKRDADILLDVLQATVATGQQQLFVRESSFDYAEGLVALFRFFRESSS